MTYSVRAQGMWRAVRGGLARLNSLLLEEGSSDEDLVFHIRNSESEARPLDQQLLPPRPVGRRAEPPFGPSP